MLTCTECTSCCLSLYQQSFVHSPVHLYEMSTVAVSAAVHVLDVTCLQHVTDAGVRQQDFVSIHSVLSSATDISAPAQH